MSGITITGSVTINQGVTMGIGTTPPPSPAVTFGTPTIMNSGAFISLLQPNSSDINSSGSITVVGSNNGDFGTAVSSNGTSWTGPSVDISGSTFMPIVTWSSYHNLFLAVGINSSNYPIYSTSSDGVTWSSPAVINATGIGNLWSLAVNSAGVFVVIMITNPGGAAVYSTSTDVTSWTTPASITGITSGVYFQNSSITVNSAGNFVVTGYNAFDSTAWSSFSANGSSWSSQQFSSGFTPRAVTWSSYHNLFVTVGGISGGLAYSTSTNGTTWTTPVSIAGSTSLMQILSLEVNSAGVFVGVGQLQVGGSGQPLYMTSTNGTDWCVPTSFNGSTSIGYMRGVMYSTVTSKFVAVGVDNGTNWIYAVSA
jgi:hypothetical protein